MNSHYQQDGRNTIFEKSRQNSSPGRYFSNFDGQVLFISLGITVYYIKNIGIAHGSGFFSAPKIVNYGHFLKSAIANFYFIKGFRLTHLDMGN